MPEPGEPAASTAGPRVELASLGVLVLAALGLPLSSGAVAVLGHHLTLGAGAVVLGERLGGRASLVLRCTPAVLAGYAVGAFHAGHVESGHVVVEGWIGAVVGGGLALGCVATGHRGKWVRGAAAEQSQTPTTTAAWRWLWVASVVLAVSAFAVHVAIERRDPPVELAIAARIADDHTVPVGAWRIRRGDRLRLETVHVDHPDDAEARGLCSMLGQSIVDARLIDEGLLLVEGGLPPRPVTLGCLLAPVEPRAIRGWTGRFAHSAVCAESLLGALAAGAIFVVLQWLELLRRDGARREAAARGAVVAAAGVLGIAVAWSAVMHRIVVH